MQQRSGTPSRGTELSGHELSRIIDFLRKLRGPFDTGLPGARPDVFWNVVLELVDAHLRQSPIDKSGLIALARVPYSTGNRMVIRMIADGQIRQVPRGAGLKTHFLEPTEELIEAFVAYAKHVKAHLARTFGLRKGAETDEYYFGGSYFAAQIISPIRGDDIAGGVPSDIRFLLNDDNYFAAMRNMWSDFRHDLGRRSSFDLRRLPDLYAAALAESRKDPPEYDVIALNMPWIGEFAEGGLLAPLDELLTDAAINPLDFHPTVWGTGSWKGVQYGIPLYCTVEILAARRDLFEERGLAFPRTFDELLTDAAINPLDFHPTVWGTGSWKGVQYGIPLYCTVEILAARRDLFEERGLAFPRTFDETIAAARELHQPARDFYGIAWNGQRGMPIANSFMFFLAACQRSVIDLPPRNQDNWGSTDFERLKLSIDVDDAVEVIEYMRQLAEVSPPDIANIDWERRIHYFLSGQVGLVYCWTMRAARFEHELTSRVARRVAYLPPPSRRMRRVAAPIGGFLLTIPAAVPLARQRQIMTAMAWMVSPEAMKAHVKNGFPVAPRFSVCADPEALASSPIVSFVDGLARRNEVVTWARPPVPAFNIIERTLGEEIHDAVFGGKPARQALRSAENQIHRAIAEQRRGV